MRFVIPSLVCLFSSLISVGAEVVEPKPILTTDVVSWPEYRQAKVCDLVELEYSEAKILEPGKIPDNEIRKGFEDKIAAILERLDFPIPKTFEWDGCFGEFYFVEGQGVNDTRVFCGIELETKGILSFYLTQNEPFPGSLTKRTAEEFLGYAREIYGRVYEEKMLGDPSLGRGGEGAEDFRDYSVSVTTIVEGVTIGGSWFEIKKTNEGGYSLSCHRGPGEAEIAQVKSYLAKHPAQFSQRDAMAIVLKTWEKIGKLPEGEPADRVSVYCLPKKVEQQWRGGIAAISNQMSWESRVAKNLGDYPYTYEVGINYSLFHVRAEVDWESGEILWMKQGTMGW